MIRLTLAAALLLAASPALALEMMCEGPLGPDATLADIEAAFGKENVVTGEVDGPEGTTFIATTVYPDDPEGKFEVYWWDEDKVEGLIGFTIAPADTGPAGLALNMSIEEVEAINGGPFELFGFYWDYGGSAGFPEGKIAEAAGDCFVNVRFSAELEPATQAISEAISGDVLLRSDMPEVRSVKPYVVAITVSHPSDRYVADE